MDIYYYYLSLDFGAIAHGQIWRLVTFLLYPGLTSVNPFNILIFGLMAWVYYSIGTSLENIWGAFRFNLYYLSGIVLSVLAALIIYLTFGVVWPVGFTYINQALFLAFAFLFPNTTFLLFYIIPVKAKWLGIFYAAVTALDVFELLTSHTKNGFVLAAAIIISMLNFIIFFIFSHNNGKPSYKTYKRRAEFRKEASPRFSLYTGTDVQYAGGLKGTEQTLNSDIAQNVMVIMNIAATIYLHTNMFTNRRGVLTYE